MPDYMCDRCGYETNRISNMKKHLSNKIACEPKLMDISREDVLEKYDHTKDKPLVCNNCQKRYTTSETLRVHRLKCLTKKQIRDDILEDVTAKVQSKLECLEMENKKLQMKLHMLKEQKTEPFYQLITEKQFNASHKTLECGVTDVTTDTCLVEVKEWCFWKEALGQLLAYNFFDKKQDLRAYMFGKYPDKCKQLFLQVATHYDIKLFEFDHVSDSVVNIVSYPDKEVVFSYTVEV